MDKSTQNESKTLPSELSAGDRERVSNQCPPNMSETVKAALLKEIEEFDAGLARQEAEASATGGASVSAYHDWLDNHGDHEPPEANPDVVSDEDGIKYLNSKKDKQTTRLLEEFRQSLTPRQLQVWNLIMVHQMSFGKAAKLIGISKPTLIEYLNDAKDKLRKFGEVMKNARQD